MNSHPDYPPKKIDYIIKIRSYVLIFALLSIFLSAIAYGSSDVKDILTPEERIWLTKNQSRIVLAVETGYAPFVFLDSGGQPAGLANDYMLLLESKLGVHFKQRRFSSLNDIFEKVRSGEVTIVNAVTSTPERSKFLAMTDSFVSVPNVIIVRKERPDQMRKENLSGLKVSLVKSYAVTERLTNEGLGFIPDLVPDDLAALLNVSFGRSDAAVIDLATASYLISRNGITNLRVAGEAAYDIRLSIGTSIGEPVLHSILQKGLDAITDEERQEIHQRWINTSSQSILTSRWFWVVVGSVLFVVLVVIAVILIWNRTLWQQVALRTEALAKEKEVLKKTEVALRTSEERLKLAVASGQVGIWDLNLQTNELIWDDTMFALYGSRREDFSGAYDAWSTRLHPQDRAATEGALRDAIAGIREYEPEFRVVWPDGEVHYIKGHARVIKDEFGNPVRVIGTNWDNSSHAYTQQQLRLAHTAINKSRSAFFWLNSEGRVTDVNDYACQSLGYSREELLGKHVWDFDQNLSAESWPDSWAESRRKVSRMLESHHRRKDGTIFPVEIIDNNLTINGEEYSFSFVNDITGRKQAEAELRIAATAFESHESMIITDADEVILRINQAFTETTGFTAEEVVGQTPRLLKSGRHNAEFYRDMWETIRRTGKWQGEIWDRRKNGEVYPKWLTISAVKNDNGEVSHYVGSHTDITERKATEEKMLHLAFYDHLTDLPNRLLLMDRLKQALASSARSSREGALLYIDMDNFKNLNDTLGHDIGDLLLKQVTQRLKSCIREGDTVARLGGDEFMVMLLDLSEQPFAAAAQTKAIGEKIFAVLNQPYQLGSYLHHCTASIGATLFLDHKQAIDELIKQADIAMYQSKKAGRNTLRFFDPQMQTSITARVLMGDELRNAIEKQQFRLYYQIQVDSLHRPLGAEALIRWIHPEQGFVSPAQFIPLAEESGLILPIGLWVLETACDQIRSWQQEALTRDLVLAVNVSAKQFRQADFVGQVEASIRRYGINPRLLKLELTEGMLVENIDEVIDTMKALKEIGVQFSLDDFGTGYSSLQYLRQLPLDQLKIDQSFVRDMGTAKGDNSILQTIIAMAKSMNLDVIAEGVETEEQQQVLHFYGCNHYQGYLFSKPVPIEQFEALLKQV